LYSKDQTAAPVPNLQMLNPTAVDMASASAQRSSLPLYLGLAALAGVVVAGVVISKRRTA
jgi:hypothetical protein